MWFQRWHIWAVCVTCQNWEVGLSPLDGSLQDKSEVPKDQMELQHNLRRKQCGPSWGLVHILQPVQQKTHSWLSCTKCGAYSGHAKRFCWHVCSWSDTRKHIITQNWWPCPLHPGMDTCLPAIGCSWHPILASQLQLQNLVGRAPTTARGKAPYNHYLVHRNLSIRIWPAKGGSISWNWCFESINSEVHFSSSIQPKGVTLILVVTAGGRRVWQ